MRRSPAVLRALLFVAVAFTAAAQEPPEQETSIFSEAVDVNVVNLDVVVTDRAGRPVTGLTLQDFQIEEDGQPVEIVNFAAFSQDVASGADSITPSDAQTSSPDLVLAVFVDNRSIRPENRRLLFQSLRGYLRERSDLTARWVVAALGHRLEIAVPLTDDLDEVYAALDRLEDQASLFAAFDGGRRLFLSQLEHASLRRYNPPTGALGDPDFDDAVRVALNLLDSVRSLAEQRLQAARSSLDGFAAFCESLAGLPGRKAVLFLSDGLPLRPADSLIAAWIGKYQTWALQNEEDIRLRSRFPEAPGRFQRLMTRIDSSDFDLQAELNRISTDASDAGLTVYPISAGGRSHTLISAEVSGAAMQSATGAGSMRRDAAAAEGFEADSSLMRLAENTGGQALLRSASLDDFFDRLRRDAANFYSLGFAPRVTDAPGAFRRLEVKVDRAGTVVRHPRGYRPRDWRRRLGQLATMTAIHELDANPLGVELEPRPATPLGKRFRLSILVKIPFDSIRLVHREQHFNAQITLLVLVRDADGALSETRRIDLPIKVPDDRMLYVVEQKATYVLELELEPGAKRIVVGVRDHLGASESTAALDLLVGSAAAGG
jgi:VWFA-related protein